MLYLDLDELPALFDGYAFASARRRALAEFRRSDHLGDPALALSEEIRALVGARTGVRPQGPVRLLTNLRYFGLCFNPVSFYYCFEDDGQSVAAVVAEVTNTPWLETPRLRPAQRPSRCLDHAWRFRKGIPRVPVHGYGSHLRLASYSPR